MKKIFCLTALLLIGACSSSTSTDDGNGASIDGPDSLDFSVSADFEPSATTSLTADLSKTATGQCEDLDSPITREEPVLEDGLDCDGDGGIVAHVTPSQYSIAFKKIVLVPEDVAGEDAASIDILADTGTLTDSEVIDFTSADPSETLLEGFDITAMNGSYSGVEVEIYYIQMTFSVAGVETPVRIYMSDDDFEAEGNLGHHQGDITLIGEDGTELGWVDETWLAANLAQTRGEEQNGAGGLDGFSGHVRGFFGDETFWNTVDTTQSATQDIFTTTLDFDSVLDFSLAHAGATGVFATLGFSVADTFFYEDCEPQNTEVFPGFFPDTGGEATEECAEWAPLAPTIAAGFSAISAL